MKRAKELQAATGHSDTRASELGNSMRCVHGETQPSRAAPRLLGLGRSLCTLLRSLDMHRLAEPWNARMGGPKCGVRAW